MPPGGNLRRVASDKTASTLLEAAPTENHVLLEVSGDGPGIKPEGLKRVFDPFLTTKGVDKGSGLGLSMVHGFAKKPGGQAAIRSETGGRITISIYLSKPANR